jgi:glycosyltransferase involved in cell wall biosynthesis
MQSYRVFITGGDKVGWALDTDKSTVTAALALSSRATIVDRIDQANVVLSVSYKSLLRIPDILRKERIILAQLSQSVNSSLREREFLQCLDIVDNWMAPSRKALVELSRLGVPVTHTPYMLPEVWLSGLLLKQSENTFASDEVLKAKRAGYFVVGNFHRDSEGSDLGAPKLEKGPDLFAEILRFLVKNEGRKIVALLVGPRRHWLRAQLKRYKVPFIFAGRECPEDDIRINSLTPEELRYWYSLCDAYVVSSRSEGGPRTLLEAIAAGVPLLSTPVGLSSELLAQGQLYTGLAQGVQAFARLLDDPAAFLVHQEKLKEHRISAVTAAIEDAITQGSRKAKRAGKIMHKHVQAKPWDAFLDSGYKAWLTAKSRLLHRRSSGVTVSIWYDFHKPPYGGGNQFALALEHALTALGVNVLRNAFSPQIDAYILNGFWFNEAGFSRIRGSINRPILHRVDGPSSLVRGDASAEVDESCLRMNKAYATHTVLQSAWSARELVAMGLQFKEPIVIHNAADPRFFFPSSDARPVEGRRIRVIGSSWSNNPRKGAKLYKEFAEKLNLSKYEFLFVGRVAEELPNTKIIPPVPSRELGEILRTADIYITASQKDPCSNALIEALSCGLPAAYFRDGGHPELVGFGGAGFDDADGAIRAVEEIATHHDSHRKLIAIDSMESVAKKYLAHVGIKL